MSRMRWIVFIMAALFSLNFYLSQDGTVFFEGEIEYSIKYPSKVEDAMEIDVESREVRMIFILKDGETRKQYFSPSGRLLREVWLDLEKKKSFMRLSNNDTLYWFDLSKHDNTSSFEWVGDTIISGFLCKKIHRETIAYRDGSKQKADTLESVFSCSTKLKINPKWYEFFLEEDYNKFVELSDGIPLNIKEENPVFEVDITMQKVIRRMIDRDEVKIAFRKNEIFKEL